MKKYEIILMVSLILALSSFTVPAQNNTKEAEHFYRQDSEKENGSYPKAENYWSQFRGPNCSGLASSDSRPPTEFGENKNLLWKIDLPVGTSSPVVWKNNIYLTAFVKENNELQTLCVESSSGKIIWTQSVFPEKMENVHPISNPAQTTIAVDESGVYVYFASCGIRSYTHAGEMRWNLTMPVSYKDYGHASSPVIMDDKLLLSFDYGDEKTRFLKAFHKNTGEIAWKIPMTNKTGYGSHSTPIRYNDQVILHRCGSIGAYSLKDGSPVWWLPLMTLGRSTPVIHNNTVFVGAWTNLSEKERRGNYFEYDTFEKALTDFDQNNDKLISENEIPMDLLFFLRPELINYMEADEYDIVDKKCPVRLFFNMGMDQDENGFVDQAEWTGYYMYWKNLTQDLGLLALPLGLTGELSMEDITWMQLEKNPEVPSPVFCNNSVYMTADGGWVTCMDAVTGEVTFQEKIGLPGPCIASPVAANGNIFSASHNGNVMVITAEKKPTVVSRTRLTGKILATPAVNGNCLYIRTTKHLYAFQEK